MPVSITKLPNGTTIRRRVRKKKPGNTGWWSESEKNNAAKLYVKEGTYAEVCRQTNIPEDTLRKWGCTDWWKEKLYEFSHENTLALSGKLGKVLEKAISTVEDRLENGDLIFNPKTGKVSRVGVKAAVANNITKNVLEKKLELDKVVNKTDATDEQVSQRLQNLKDEFMKFMKSKTIVALPENTIVIDNKETT